MHALMEPLLWHAFDLTKENFKVRFDNIILFKDYNFSFFFQERVRLSNPPAIVPCEQAFYIYYMSRRQKRLQKELEDRVMHYKRKLQMIIEDAVWYCKRNQVNLKLYLLFLI